MLSESELDHGLTLDKSSFAADTLCTFMESQEGWEVNRGICDLPTAWSATWTSPYGKGPRTIGFNSEMDALPGIGHACGHNLIAVAGLASAIATAKALEDARYPGTVVLLGTPAEEGGGGKCLMLERGAYDGMDACMMVHPGPFDCVGSSLAVRHFTVRFRGKTAHAAATPWAGVNALDAAVLAYNGVSVLRQQTEDGIRIQGIMLPETDWAPNVIPDVARLSFGVRAPTVKQMNHYMGRVLECFRGAAISTGCSVEISEDEEPYYDIVVNSPLAEMYASLMDKYEGIKLATNVPFSGSTDFGNVTHKLPGLHPLYEIPLDNRMKNANHTIGFTKAAATKEAHEATMRCAASIAATAALFVTDDAFADAVVLDWKEQQRLLAEQESCE